MIAFIDLAKVLDDAGFPGGTPQLFGIAVVCAESGRDPAARNVNADGSVDRGLWQINSRWHPEVSDADAFAAVPATAAALKISGGGLDYSAWSTWQNGSYKAHLEAARVALDGWSRIKWLTKASQQQAANMGSQIANLTAAITLATSTLRDVVAELDVTA